MRYDDINFFLNINFFATFTILMHFLLLLSIFTIEFNLVAMSRTDVFEIVSRILFKIKGKLQYFINRG